LAIRKARALAVSLIVLKQDAGITIQYFQYKASIQDSPAKHQAVKKLKTKTFRIEK